jgi:hypothetical protein
MKRTGNIASWWLTLAVMVIMGWLPIPAGAQQGQNAVYNSSGTCSPNCAVSAAFIDAYAVWKSLGGANFCGVLNTILNPQSGIFPTTGGLIDARGLNSSHVSMKCTASPWAGITSPPPSNILLPAGTIVIPTAWTLPPQTHLIGQGDNPSSGTVIQACTSTTCTNSFSGTAMIQFCSGSGCSGVSVEKLILDGQGQQSSGSYISGIINQYSQVSYVDHVSLYQILGRGLSISGGASNSGPYTNITFDTGGHSGVPSTVCVSLNGLSNTRGIRGLSCTSRNGANASAAVLLDSSSNLIKDVTIVGFYDGILVGENAPAQSNVLVNVIGDTSCAICGSTPIRAIHISSIKTGGTNNVQDLSILGVANDVSGTYTIWDDLTGAEIQDPFVGLYVLGKPANNGYARFTTSPGYPTWAAGSAAPSMSAMCTQGSLYSCTGFGSTGGSSCKNTSNTPIALWACPSSNRWVSIK